jgi:hypothetical protein
MANPNGTELEKRTIHYWVPCETSDGVHELEGREFLNARRAAELRKAKELKSLVLTETAPEGVFVEVLGQIADLDEQEDQRYDLNCERFKDGDSYLLADENHRLLTSTTITFEGSSVKIQACLVSLVLRADFDIKNLDKYKLQISRFYDRLSDHYAQPQTLFSQIGLFRGQLAQFSLTR